METELWMVRDLPPPPFLTESHQRRSLTPRLKDVKQTHSDIEAYLGELRRTNVMDTEVTLLSKLISRFSNNLKSHKSIHNMKKIQRCMNRWTELNISHIIQPLCEDFKVLSTMTTSATCHIQSAQCMSYILTRLMSGAALLGQTTVYSVLAYSAAYQELLVGNFITKMLIFMALASRIRLLCIRMLETLMECYQRCYKLLLLVYPQHDVTQFPLDLKPWLENLGYCTVVAPHLESKMAESSEKLSDFISKYANDNDMEPESMEGIDPSLSTETPEKPSLENESGENNSQYIGEVIEREDSETEEKCDEKCEGNTSGKGESREDLRGFEMCKKFHKQLQNTNITKKIKRKIATLEGLATEILPKEYQMLEKMLSKCKRKQLEQAQCDVVLRFIRKLKIKCREIEERQSATEEFASQVITTERVKKLTEYPGYPFISEDVLESCENRDELVSLVETLVNQSNCNQDKKKSKKVLTALQSVSEGSSQKKNKRLLLELRKLVLIQYRLESEEHQSVIKSAPKVLNISTENLLDHFSGTITNKQKLINLPSKITANDNNFTYLGEDYKLSGKRNELLKRICEKYSLLMPKKTDQKILHKAVMKVANIFRKELQL